MNIEDLNRDEQLLVSRMSRCFDGYDLTSKWLMCELALNNGFTANQFENYGFHAIEEAAQRKRLKSWERRNPDISERSAESNATDSLIGVAGISAGFVMALAFHVAVPLVWIFV